MKNKQHILLFKIGEKKADANSITAKDFANGEWSNADVSIDESSNTLKWIITNETTRIMPSNETNVSFGIEKFNSKKMYIRFDSIKSNIPNLNETIEFVITLFRLEDGSKKYVHYNYYDFYGGVNSKEIDLSYFYDKIIEPDKDYIFGLSIDIGTGTNTPEASYIEIVNLIISDKPIE